MSAQFWIGTSGWHYAHWRGRFYPDTMPPSRWFAFYAARFATVELNASFYRLPRRQTWQGWQRAAPAGFTFAVKASRFITHIKRLHDCAEPLQTFLDSATILGDRLGPILYQLPPGFHRTPENIERLSSFLSLLPPGLRHVFEFRHASWFDEESLALLRRHGIGFCSYDMAGIDCPLVATADFAYMRFHGGVARYASDYPEEQLRSWAERLRLLADASSLTDVYVYFNNDYNAYAVFNAQTLRRLLTG